jgi:hypothetical protein
MSAPDATKKKVWQEAELEALPEDGFIQLAWIIDPEPQLVEVCQSPTRRQLIGSGGYLDGSPLLPDSRYPIADLFREWDWE